MSVERRDFIKQACGVCAALVGITAILPAVTACAPLKTVVSEEKEGSIHVPLSNFTSENNLVILRSKNNDFDIALVKFSADKYRAFEMQCTHQPNALVATKTGFFCNVHGSRFALDGSVSGAPATQPLKEYALQLNGDAVIVKL